MARRGGPRMSPRIRSWRASSSSGSERRVARRIGRTGARSITPANGALATRQASGLALQAITAAVPNLVGGSADLGGQHRDDTQAAAASSARRPAAGPFIGECASTAWPRA